MYLLFAGSNYYPEGGAEDLKGKYETVEQAIAGHAPSNDPDDDWANILCLDTLTIVKCNWRGEWRDPDHNRDW